MIPTIGHIRNRKPDRGELFRMADAVSRQALRVRTFGENEPWQEVIRGPEAPRMSTETKEALLALADYLDGRTDTRGDVDGYGTQNPPRWSQQHAAHLMRSAKEHADQDLHTDRMDETTHTAFVRDLLELALRLTELSATQGGQKTLDRVARGEMGKNRTPNRFQWGARNREAEEG